MNNNTNLIDNIDKEIIKKLNQNGRKSFRRIAKELDLSVGTITNRINKLKNEGIIKGFQLELDYKQLGYNIETIIEINITGNIDKLLSKYTNNIAAVHKTTGEYDMILITRFKDTVELNRFLEILREEENVKKTYTHLILSNMNN